MPTENHHKHRRDNIAVIVPVYNREDIIVDCLDTVVQQTLPPAEIIIVDDGSSDGTADVLSKWMQKQTATDIQIRYIHQKNAGKSSALNTGFSVARSEWIAFNDSDDFWLPNKLETQVEILASNPQSNLCFTDSKFINDPALTESNFQIRGFDKILAHQSILTDPFIELARNPNGIFMQSILVHRDCAKKVFPLDPNLRVAQDIDLIFRLSLQCDFCLSHETLVAIDRTPDRSIGLTKQHDMKSLFRLETRERIFKGWLEIDSEKTMQVEPLIRKHLSTVQRRIAINQKVQRNSAQSRRYFKQAFENRKSVRNLLSWLLNHSLWPN